MSAFLTVNVTHKTGGGVPAGAGNAVAGSQENDGNHTPCIYRRQNASLNTSVKEIVFFVTLSTCGESERIAICSSVNDE